MAKKKNHTPVVKQPKILGPNAKKRKKPIYKSFRLHKRIKMHGQNIPSWWILFKKALLLLRVNWRPLSIFFIVFAVFNLLFIRGFESIINTDLINETLTEIVDEENIGLAGGFTAFGLLLNSSGVAQGEITQLYQSILLLIGSLAVIWLFRQQQANNKVTMKQAFYRGMYPLVPFFLIVLVIGLQLLPALVGNFLFQTVVQADLIVGSLELFVWIMLLFLTFLLSLYMLAGSIISLYIVTLPEMTPMIALREARELVRYRRTKIVFRMIALILVMAVILFVVVLPIIFFAPIVAEWIFFALTILAIPFTHAYMFSLYRELL